jgi:hypothetical protein
MTAKEELEEYENNHDEAIDYAVDVLTKVIDKELLDESK